MCKKLLIAVGCMLMFAGTAIAQTSLKGTITDSRTGEVIPGANVYVLQLETGTATGIDGDYTLPGLQPGTFRIRVSYIGYTTITEEIQLSSGENTRNFELRPDIGLLDEIIVSGVADDTPKRKLTVSVTRVDASRLNQVPATSAATALAGKIPGLTIRTPGGTPGGNTNIMLRADNNLNVGYDPLIIVDGAMIRNGNLADFNVDDIQSIEVVKGAAASSLYGSRAGNGVIVVTTKRGALNEQGVIEVNVRNEVGFSELERKLDLAMHHQYELADDWQSFQGQYTKYAGVQYPAGYIGGYHPEIIGTRAEKADGYMDNPYGLSRDPQDQFFKTGTNMTNFVSLSTRIDNLNLYGSFEHNQQEGIIPDTDGYSRNNFRLNADYYLSDWLRLSASNTTIHRESNFPGGGGGIFFNLVLAEPDNILTLPNPDGQPYYYRHNHWSNEENPLYNTHIIDRTENVRRFLGNYSLRATPFDWMEYRLNYSLETYNESYTEFAPFHRYVLNPSEEFGIGYGRGSLYKYAEEQVIQSLQHTLITRQDFDRLYATLTLSYLYEDDSREFFNASGSNFEVRDLPRFQAINRDNITAGSTIQDVRAENFFAILSLDWDDKYLVDGMVRRDGSSLFGSDARWRTFYRVSAAYRISEDFDIPHVNELKLRGAMGSAGIRPGFAYQYETFSISNGNTSKGTLGNSDLRPSYTLEKEVAIEATMFDRLNLEVSYSTALTKDQFVQVPLLPVVGFSSQWQNAGDITSSTWEFSANGDIINNRDMYWNMGVVWATSEQEITKLNVPAYTISTSQQDGMFYMREGERYGAMYGNTFVRSLEDMANQLPAGTTINDFTINSEGFVIRAGTEGTPTEAVIKLLDENGDLAFVKIGDGRPDWQAAFTNTFRYKGLSAYVLVDIKQGGDIYNRKGQWLTRDRRNGIMDQAGKPADEKKAVGYYLSLYDVNSNNSYWVEDGSYVKLREVALSYQFTPSQLSVFGGAVKGATLSLIGRNLFTFSNYSGYDPEVGGIRYPIDTTGSYPNFRNYSFSVSLTF